MTDEQSLLRLATAGALRKHKWATEEAPLYHSSSDGHAGDFITCPHPDCVLVRRWTPAQPVCFTCGGRGWVTVSQVNFTPDPVMGSGGSWNEPCPQCRPSASAFPETPQP